MPINFDLNKNINEVIFRKKKKERKKKLIKKQEKPHRLVAQGSRLLVLPNIDGLNASQWSCQVTYSLTIKSEEHAFNKLVKLYTLSSIV